MSKIAESCNPVKARTQFETALLEAEASLRQTIGQELTELLVAIVQPILGRPYHRRRKKVSKRPSREGKCCRCGSRTSRRFTRNGFRRRQLLTRWGELCVPVPRVRCECGGSVSLDFGGLLRPYQRIWHDVEAQIQWWGALAVSLRQMRNELANMHIGPLALRTLNRRLLQLVDLTPLSNLVAVPPILQIDAIWITVLRPTGEWVTFLRLLEAQGIRGENGLKLVIHDGGSGLCSALHTVYFGADSQRCLFHKLRNIYNAIHVSEDLSPKQRRRRRKTIFKDFHAIYQAQRYDTVLRRYLKVVRAYRHSQPQAVATLRRDFRATITYYHLQQQFLAWERRHLRSTSRLERFNRRLRRRARAANAYHSDQGLVAMVSQEAHQFHAAQHDS